MERRKSPDRRKMHVFFSDERRLGPFDRRDAAERLEQRKREMEKIEKIKAYRQRDAAANTPSPTQGTGRFKWAVVLGLVVVLAVAAFALF